MTSSSLVDMLAVFDDLQVAFVNTICSNMQDGTPTKPQRDMLVMCIVDQYLAAYTRKRLWRAVRTISEEESFDGRAPWRLEQKAKKCRGVYVRVGG